METETADEFDMNTHLRSHIIVVFTAIAFALTGCVSVNLPKTSKGKAEEVKLVPPDSPFESVKSERADQTWKNRSTAATISYLSDCNDNPESLENFQSESAAALKDGKLISTEDIEFNDRPAKKAIIEGAMEGIRIRMMHVVFRKNSCDFIISYVAKAKSFDKDAPAFLQFLEKFEAP